MDWLDYRERLGIGFHDERREKFFYTKIFNELNLLKIDRFEIGQVEYYFFCQATGCEMRMPSRQYDDLDRYRDCVSILREHSGCLEDFLSYYIMLYNSMDADQHIGFSKADFLEILKRNLSEAHIQYEILQDTGGFFIFPKGAEELDNALVSQPLVWLSEYPQAHTAFTKALKEYAKASPENASDIADKFRKSLETFMQEFFPTDKTLENCKAIYGGYLKEKGVPKEIAGNLETLLNSYTMFMNGYAKHHDNTGVNVLEYIMYQTGNIIRLLLTLKKNEMEET